METVGLILSGQKIDHELSMDFGDQIPILLPYQGKPLYFTQLQNFPKRCTKIFILIPKDFTLGSWIEQDLANRGSEIIRCESGLDLKDAFLFALAEIKKCYLETPEILIQYGDTLNLDFSAITPNSLFVVEEPSHYRWGKLINQEGSEVVFAGGLSVTDPNTFEDCLLRYSDLIKTLQILLERNLFSTISSTKWLDYGHLGTYYKSRALEVEARHFNSIELADDVVTKSSSDRVKIQGEINWFQSIPSEFRKYTSKFIAHGDDSYQIEFIPFPTIYELEIFGNLSKTQWGDIFKKILDLFLTSKALAPSRNRYIYHANSWELINHKTYSRFDAITNDVWKACFGDSAEKIKRSMRSQIKALIEELKSNRKHEILGVLHGDMCTTNIFYSHLSDKLKIVDPRGLSHDGETLVYGDITYDIAKLYQSLFLGYDAILAGRYRITQDTTFPKVEVQTNLDYATILEIFEKSLVQQLKVPLSYIRKKANLLLLSLIPLHSDTPEKQKAFLLVAYFELVRQFGYIK